MEKSKSGVRFLVFDVESVADGRLVSRIRFPEESLDDITAVARYRAELLAKHQSDFIPYTFQIPIAVVIAKVADDFRLVDLVSLDEPQHRPHVLTDFFWRGWERYGRPTWVSFNGRTFDMPLMELAAFRFGVSLRAWSGGSGYEAPRNRYNAKAHLDLCDVLTNFGASRFNGGLNLAASLLGKPGKMDVHGYMVQDLHQQGAVAEISNYCRCDVLDTYFVFLRTQVLLGNLPLDEEQRIVGETKAWLEERRTEQPAYATYLGRWGDWENPWKEASPSP
ncbi:MAG: 3'-5' exonuclease [Planctomycetes bacterium]|nr:3'-5' exonuclease [Planctomycetota bacterium]